MLKVMLAPFVALTYGLFVWPRDALRSARARRRLRGTLVLLP
jgi:hypothetical protein